MPDFSQTITTQQKISETVNLIGLILICYFTGQLIGQLLTQWLFDFSAQELANLLMHPEQARLHRNSIIFLQTCSALFSYFIFPAAYFYFFLKKKTTTNHFTNTQLMPLAVGLTVVLVIVYMPINAIFIEWNKQLQLPDWLSALERQLQQREQKAAELTALFTRFTTVEQLLTGILFIGLIPAIGEEFFFRGIFQTRLAGLLKNQHVVILITGFLFSLFHLQFYGLLPRMLQGILFGYLFWWSKSLWYPIIAHFTNNTFIVLMHYFWQHNHTRIHIADTASVPFYVSLASLVLSCIVVIALKQCFFRHPIPS